MKREILTIVLAGGLLISSQALAGGQAKQLSGAQGEATQIAAQAGDQAQHQAADQKLNEEQTKEMQRLLNEQGYKVGSADGTMNPETMEAVRKFQDSEGLAVTGMPNQETLRTLAPSSDQQEFFGLSPEFGEIKEKSE